MRTMMGLFFELEEERPMKAFACIATFLSLPIILAFCLPPAAQCETPEKLTPSGAPPLQSFGYSVAVSGDTAVIGAPVLLAESVSAAYVFTRTRGGWTQVAELTQSDAEMGDLFGLSVAIDGETIVVGAREHTGAVDQQGAAYVFVRPATGWTNMTETAELTASDAEPIAYLGNSVAISGRTVVAGAPLATGASEGAAYIFVEPTTGWATTSQFTSKLVSLDGGEFGWSVALEGDTLAIGAQQGNSAYVFVKPPSGWSHVTQTAQLTADSSAFLGSSIAISGNTICVGAIGSDSDSGAAYVYVEPGQGWVDMTQTAELTPSDGVVLEWFGISVAVFDSKIVAGATYAGSAPGAAYVFVQPEGGWRNATQNAKLTESDGIEANGFGQSVFLGSQGLFVGAPSDGASVYVY
jgi:FG-GAP repeat